MLLWLNPKSLAGFVGYLLAVAVRESDLQVFVSQKNLDARAGDVVHRNFLVRTDVNAENLNLIVFKFHFHGWTVVHGCMFCLREGGMRLGSPIL